MSVVCLVLIHGCGSTDDSHWIDSGMDSGASDATETSLGDDAEDGALDVEDDGIGDGMVDSDDAQDCGTSGACEDGQVGTDGDPDGDGVEPCPMDMVLVEAVCIDRYEAPNREGAKPLVMFNFEESESWCQARGKRLCFDDEWTRACGGEDGLAYPYGEEHVPGVCTDDKLWKAYNQTLLNGWPWSMSNLDAVEDLEELFDVVAALGTGAAAAASHVKQLYQADPSGLRDGCTTGDGTYDLTGNVEEWTRRRDGGTANFHGNLKGRFWADSRTCQQSLTTHGDQFRFYEIGFRCCRDALVLD